MSRPTQYGAVFLALFAVLALRWMALDWQLWLDEIWALQASREVKGLTDLFSDKVRDGHFSLYTLYLGLLGDSPSNVLVRLPSWIAGGLHLLFVYHFAHRRAGAVAGWLALLLTSSSYFFTMYATEARSYAIIGAAMLAALLLHERQLEAEPERKWIPLFWIVIIGAVLVHLSFLPWYVGFAFWSFLVCSEGTMRGRWLQLHLLPLTVLGALYIGFFATLGEGTGPLVSRLDIAIDLFSYIAGGPPVSPASPPQTMLAFCVALAALLMIILAVRTELKRRSSYAFLFLFSVVLLPVGLIVLLNPRILLPRYFYLSAIMAVVLLSIWFARLLAVAGLKRLTAIGLIAVITAMNGWQLARFAKYSRGDLQSGVRLICSVDQREITVAGDHLFRDQMIISYFGPRECQSKALHYIQAGKPSASAAEFLVRQSQDTGFVPPTNVKLDGQSYILSGSFPYSGLSGWSWFIYRRSPAHLNGLS